jgi:preprotein translocase subunit Sec63
MVLMCIQIKRKKQLNCQKKKKKWFIIVRIIIKNHWILTNLLLMLINSKTGSRNKFNKESNLLKLSNHIILFIYIIKCE